jgi:hypothetical protein
MIFVTTDHEAQVDKFASSAFMAGAATGIMEAHALLSVLQKRDAADLLIKHWDSILRRAMTHQEAAAAVSKAAA